MAALEIETLIGACQTVLEGVSGIGRVHDYRREVRNESDARSLWVVDDTGQINAWQVTLGEPAVSSVRHPGFGAIGSSDRGTVLADISLVFEGVMGINDADASEKTFRALTFEIMRTFNGIGRVHADVVQQDPVQWTRFGYLVLAGIYMVHFAQLRCRFTGRTF